MNSTTQTQAPTHEPRSRPTFRERVHMLAGHSTWRDGDGSGCTGVKQIPADHLVAAALAFGRHSPDDIGPDIAMDIALGRAGHYQRVCEWLGGVLAADRGASCRRMRPHAGLYAVWAYRAMVLGERVPVVADSASEQRRRDHETVLLFACMLLEQAAEDALSLAARRARA